MKRGKVIVATTAFVGLALTKMLFPDAGAGMRLRLQAALERDPDYVAVFRDLGKRFPASKKEERSAATEAAEPLRPVRTHYISYEIEEAAPLGEAETEPELPEAVTAFLESQTAFADIALPENVDYGYIPLPFDYAVPVAGRNSSGFGYRLHPILNIVRFHYGTDIAAGAGETIRAFTDGTVTFAGYDDSFGWHLKIDHGGGWVSHYCHCSRILVEKGQIVSRGDAVALVGATGLATGPHLHFELTRDGVYLNPEYYINA